MKLSVTCIYWMLLIVSVVSSGLLFLLVSSEGVQVEEDFEDLNAAENFITYNNGSLDSTRSKSTEPPDTSSSVPQIQGTCKTGKENKYLQDEATAIFTNFELFASERRDGKKDKESDIFVESLAGQPNLSQGNSEGEQAVVLSLKDTAATELQSLVEPKIGQDHHSRLISKNASSNVTSETEKTQQVGVSTEIPLLTITEQPNVGEANDSNVFNDEDNVFFEKSTTVTEETPEVVVIVRAEQKSLFSVPEIELQHNEAQANSEYTGKISEENIVRATELNDTLSRARLITESTRDEAATIILDGYVTVGPTESQEDIPSFSEWTQKRLEEAEKKKTHPNASTQNVGSGAGRGLGTMKIRSKNYASPDCGAKIVAANPESRSAKSVLVSTRDEYMLNTCSTRAWFVVELCEAIQAKKIELANFELFSSSPKDFAVYVSDRFPTRDWSPVGRFTAKDERDIQSFALHPRLFGKFIKIELLSHYGSEHFCPISLFRAYGTSEFEVLETETENQASVPQEVNASEEPDEEDDESATEEEEILLNGNESSSEPPRNLFGSARDAVLSIVKKAAEMFVKSGDFSSNDITEIQRSIDVGTILRNSYANCMTPRYSILCRNCSNQRFAKVFQLISCRDHQLNQLLTTDFLRKTFSQNSAVCRTYGVGTTTGSGNGTQDTFTCTRTSQDPRMTFLASLFNSDYIVALCNVLATRERKVVMNASYEIPTENSTNNSHHELPDEKSILPVHGQMTLLPSHSDTTVYDRTSEFSNDVPQTKSEEGTFTDTIQSVELPSHSSSSSSPSDGVASRIKPRTFDKEDPKRGSSMPVSLELNKEPPEETLQPKVLTTALPPLNVATQSISEMPEKASVVTGSTMDVITQSPVTDASGVDEATAMAEGSINEHKDDNKGDETEQDIKRAKSELDEQETKPQPQDHVILDSLLSDLKDLESEVVVSLQNDHGTSSLPVAQQSASTTPQQKESVFLRLSNRIKALERNMSLSGQYLEELSRRYKKQVEDMQRSLERAVAAMGEESRKGEEREAKRLEEIGLLKEEIAVLAQSMENLLYEREGWYGSFTTIIQHALLVCLEVLLVVYVLSYCLRIRQKELEHQDVEQRSTGARKMVNCQKSTEFLNVKKAKKRRPSEIASRISGTYRELMIDDLTGRIEPKKEKRKKRRKDTSSIRIKEETDMDFQSRTVFNIKTDSRHVDPQISRMESSSSDSVREFPYSEPNGRLNGTDRLVVKHEDVHKVQITHKNDDYKISLRAPSFMKTAVGMRSKRMLEQKSYKRICSEKLFEEGNTSSYELMNKSTNGHIKDTDGYRDGSTSALFFTEGE